MGSNATERAAPAVPITPKVPTLPKGFDSPALKPMVAVPPDPSATSTLVLSGDIASCLTPELGRATGCSWLDCSTPVLGLMWIANRFEVPEKPSTNHEFVESTCIVVAGSDDIGCPEFPTVLCP